MPTFTLNGNKLIQRDEGLWTLDGLLFYELCLVRPQFPIRMTIVQIITSNHNDGNDQGDDNNKSLSFIVVSPFPPQDEVMMELQDFFTNKDCRIRHVVAPNSLHWLWAKDFVEACRHRYNCGSSSDGDGSDIKLYVAPGLPTKTQATVKALLTWDGILPQDTPTKEWNGQFYCRHIPGIPALEEVVLFHVASKTLIVADLAFCFDPNNPQFNVGPPISWYLRLVDGYRPCCLTRTFQFLIQDAHACHDALEAVIRDWNFTRIIPCHGNITETNAKVALESGTLDFLKELLLRKKSRQTKTHETSSKSSPIIAVASALLVAAAGLLFVAYSGRTSRKIMCKR